MEKEKRLWMISLVQVNINFFKNHYFIIIVYCKLCGLLFKKDDASKVLTYKLLWELVQHLKKRGKYLPNIKVKYNQINLNII